MYILIFIDSRVHAQPKCHFGLASNTLFLKASLGASAASRTPEEEERPTPAGSARGRGRPRGRPADTTRRNKPAATASKVELIMFLRINVDKNLLKGWVLA